MATKRLVLPSGMASAQTHPATISSAVSALLDWFRDNARDLPWRKTSEPYAIWVSEIMLQQTQVKTVIPYYERWMQRLPTIESLAAVDSTTLHKLWEGLGYYTRVRNLQKAARCIEETQEGRFPATFDDVLALPGVGRYTAGAICSIAFNQPTPILDGNVIRVLTRLFAIRGVTREKETLALLWKRANELVQAASHTSWASSGTVTPTGPCSALNQSLMELGATVCLPKADCPRCPLQTMCVARTKGLVEALPNVGARPAPTARFFAAGVVERNGALLVRQRPAGVVNGHLWEFPNIEVSPECSPRMKRRQLEAELGCPAETLHPLTTVRHSITRYRMTLEAFSLSLNGSTPRAEAGTWVSKDDVVMLPFSSAHRRILAAALQKEASPP